MPRYNDNRIEDLHEEIQKDVKGPEKSLLKNIPTGTLLLFGIGVIIALFYASSKGINMNKTFFFISLMAALIILLSMNQSNRKLLTEQECKIELYHQLKFKQRNRLGDHKELPEGTIKIALKGRLRFFNGKPFKRQLGFNIITPDGYEHQFSSEVNPYTADVISIFEGYFDPRDASDMTYLAPPELLAEKRWGEYGGKTR